MRTGFRRLDGPNAQPNAPEPVVRVRTPDVWLEFDDDGDLDDNHQSVRRRIVFRHAWRYRLGEPGDEGWARGQGRFGTRDHEWGGFYEVTGDVRDDRDPGDWQIIGAARDTGSDSARRFVFYFRDEVFECSADSFEWDTTNTD